MRKYVILITALCAVLALCLGFAVLGGERSLTPTLTVTADGNSITAPSEAMRWTYPTDDGEATIETESLGTLVWNENVGRELVRLDAYTERVTLDFSVEPSEVSVRCWKDTWINTNRSMEDIVSHLDIMPDDDGSFELYPGGRIYAVRAKWEDSERGYGEATFVFHATTRIEGALYAPPALSVSAGGRKVALEPYSYSWSTSLGGVEYEETTLNDTHPLLLDDERWNDIPYLKGEPELVEFFSDIEPSSISITGYHDSYRGTDLRNDFSVQKLYIREEEDGGFAIESDSGYLYIISAGWTEESETPLYSGSAQYAFRVGRTKELDAESITAADFAKYPTAQLSNALKGTPRGDILDRYGEPDIAAGSYDLWLTEDDKFMRVAYLYPDYNTVRTIELTEGLPSFPPLLITIGGESYPVQQGTTSWQSRDGGYEACSSAPSDWDWSERTIYTDATEAVITLNVSDRLAERIDVSIDGGLISAKTAGEPFELYARSARIYEFRVSVGDAEGKGMQSLFSGTAQCAVRIAPSGE